MTLENYDLLGFVLAHKWWFIALAPVVLAIIVVKILNS